MSRPSLRQGLDRDVYQLVRKLEDELEDKESAGPPPRLTVTAVYEYIRRSNSSLGRLKRKPLEESIERVLKFRKKDLENQEESEGEEEVENPTKDTPAKPATDPSLLNRQLARRWKLAEKKEKDLECGDKTEAAESADKMSGPKKRRRSRSPSASGQGRTTDGDQPATDPRSKLVAPKKWRPNKGYEVSDLENLPVLGGISDVVADFEERIWPEMVPREDETGAGRSSVRSLLLSGPLGCGKSSILAHLASRWKIPLLKVDCEQLEGSERAERSLSDVYDEAVGMAPCIVHLTEIDTLWKSEGVSQLQPSTAGHQVKQLLLRLARVRNTGRPIAVAATTNHPERLPRKLFKAGLFEATYTMKAPSERSRREILETLGQSRGFPPLDYTAAARRTHGYVGDDLYQIVNQSQRRAMVAGRPVTLEDLDEAAKQHTPHLYKEGFSKIPDVTLDQVGGLRGVISLLELNIINRIKYPSFYRHVNKPAGVLLWGPPGCGKTYVAQAIANAAQASFILVNGPELLDKYVGESERKIRALFERARGCAPCLVFLDEIDSLVPRRENTSTEAGTRVVNTFLTELDGANGREGVYVVAATNRPDMIDPAMFRTGRFNRKVYVDMPNEEERVDILTTIFRSRGIPGDISVVEAIARNPRCENFSGADLSELSDRAVLEYIQRMLPTHTSSQTNAMQVDGLAEQNAGPSKADWEAAMNGLKPSVKNIEIYREMALADELDY